MRPVGKRRLLRYEVASDVAAAASNLLTPAEFVDDVHPMEITMLRVMVHRNWDGLADSDGAGGSRLSFVPDPFIAA